MLLIDEKCSLTKFIGQLKSKYPLCNYYRSFMTFVNIIYSKLRRKEKKKSTTSGKEFNTWKCDNSRQEVNIFLQMITQKLQIMTYPFILD